MAFQCKILSHRQNIGNYWSKKCNFALVFEYVMQKKYVIMDKYALWQSRSTNVDIFIRNRENKWREVTVTVGTFLRSDRNISILIFEYLLASEDAAVPFLTVYILNFAILDVQGQIQMI